MIGVIKHRRQIDQKERQRQNQEQPDRHAREDQRLFVQRCPDRVSILAPAPDSGAQLTFIDHPHAAWRKFNLTELSLFLRQGPAQLGLGASGDGVSVFDVGAAGSRERRR
jgi:hypothetical protein